MDELAQLNRRFGIPGTLVFEHAPDGLIMARIRNQAASADIALQGAHVCHFQPQGQASVLWLSPRAQFAPGKAIRGGIPVCWPWFGAHPTRPGFPAHGFARTAQWQVSAVHDLIDSTHIELALDTRAFATWWPYSCTLQYHVTVGSALQVALITQNTGDTAFEITEALHAYLAISDVDNIGIAGLDKTAYIDKTRNGELTHQHGALTIAGETDRVYVDTQSECLVEDLAGGRRIRVAKAGSCSTIVWNPGMDKAARMADLGAEHYRAMVCVESGNALSNAVQVAPGQSHTLSASYRAEPLGAS